MSAPLPKKAPAGRKQGPLVIRDAPLNSEEKIPAIRNLDKVHVSFGSASESMDYNDSILGKRHVLGLMANVTVAAEDKALVLFGDVPEGGLQKKGKLDQSQVDEEVNSMMREVELEATGPGAAGILTGSRAPPRQEQ